MEKDSQVGKLQDSQTDLQSEVSAPKEDYRDVMKQSRIGDGIQISTQSIKDLGILCSINKSDSDDKFVLGSYNQIALWDRKTKEVQPQKLEVGGNVGSRQEFGGTETMENLKWWFLIQAISLSLKTENKPGT